MTICVAIKVPCKELKHRTLPVKYTSGIVISADARYCWTENNRVADDGIKIWTLSKFAIAGFAGNVQLAEISLISARFAIEDLLLKRHEDVAIVVQKWLLYYYDKLQLENRPDISHTEIILSVYDTTRNKFYLYL